MGTTVADAEPAVVDQTANLEEMQESVTKLQESVDDVQESISRLSAILDYESDITDEALKKTLKGQMETLESEYEDLATGLEAKMDTFVKAKVENIMEGHMEEVEMMYDAPAIIMIVLAVMLSILSLVAFYCCLDKQGCIGKIKKCVSN